MKNITPTIEIFTINDVEDGVITVVKHTYENKLVVRKWHSKGNLNAIRLCVCAIEEGEAIFFERL